MQPAVHSGFAAPRERKPVGLYRGGVQYPLWVTGGQNLGAGFLQRLVHEREQNGPYTSFVDFCRRLYGTELNRRALESLIQCGALDDLGHNRREMLTGAGALLEQLEADRRKNVDGQLGFFDTPGQDGELSTEAFELPRLPEFPPAELLRMEKEVTGMFISGHPLAAYEARYQNREAARLADLQVEEGEVPLYGIISRCAYWDWFRGQTESDEVERHHGVCHPGRRFGPCGSAGISPGL